MLSTWRLWIKIGKKRSKQWRPIGSPWNRPCSPTWICGQCLSNGPLRCWEDRPEPSARWRRKASWTGWTTPSPWHPSTAICTPAGEPGAAEADTCGSCEGRRIDEMRQMRRGVPGYVPWQQWYAVMRALL